MKEDLRDVKPKGREEAIAPHRPTNLPADLGLAESFLATGRAAGFDMTSQEGVAAWSSEIKRRIMQGNALETSLPQAKPPENAPVNPRTQPTDSSFRGRPPH